jgi:hypothetical protein
MTRFSLTRQVPKISLIESAKTADNALIEQYGGPRLYVIFKHQSASSFSTKLSSV